MSAYQAQRATEGGNLEPCPLCGAPALLEHDSDHHGDWFNLGCSNHYEHKPDDPCPMGRLFYTESCDEESRAIQKWNTRSTSSALREMREALESIRYHSENQDMSHLTFRIKARECADAAIEKATKP